MDKCHGQGIEETEVEEKALFRFEYRVGGKEEKNRVTFSSKN